MFFITKSNKEFKELEHAKLSLLRDIENCKSTVSAYERQINEQKKTLDDIKIRVVEEIDERLSKCNFSFNFKKINAFSVERINKDGSLCTIIGYLLGEEVRQWYFYCSDEMHNSLVEEFDLWKSK